MDSNILVYSHREDSPFHRAAKTLIEALRRQSQPWAIPWPCLHEFISIVTHPGIYQPPSPVQEAFAAIDSWLAGANVQLLAESPGYLDKLRELALTARISGARLHDARVAALCLHHGVRELWSADRDFSLFPGLKTHNPLLRPPSG